MATYKITHSLLTAWLYALKENPFEDATTENSSYDDFLRTLRREPVEQSDAMTNGIQFENAVTDYLAGNQSYVPENWYDAVGVVASHIRGARLQVDIRKVISVNGFQILLHGSFQNRMIAESISVPHNTPCILPFVILQSSLHTK